MGEPKAIQYKDVAKVAGEGLHAATNLWHKVGDIAGAGHVALDQDGNAVIDLTNVDAKQQGQIDKLLAGDEESTKRGKA